MSRIDPYLYVNYAWRDNAGYTEKLNGVKILGY